MLVTLHPEIEKYRQVLYFQAEVKTKEIQKKSKSHLLIAEILDHVRHDELDQPEFHGVRAADEHLPDPVGSVRLCHYNWLFGGLPLQKLN